MQKIIFSDFDGTLYTNEEDLINNISIIKEFQKQNNLFVIASGRSFPDIKEFLQKYYDSEGKTREGVEGEVLPLGGLSPIMTPRGKGAYSLLSSQVIIGTAMVDHLGVIEIYLTYQEGKFIPYDMVIGEQGNIK